MNPYQKGYGEEGCRDVGRDTGMLGSLGEYRVGKGDEERRGERIGLQKGMHPTWRLVGGSELGEGF
jgi:hypothetical protein